MNTLVLCLAASMALASGAAAQDPLTPSPGVTPLELHQLDMSRMRLDSDVRAAEQRQQALETRLNRLEIQSRRQPAPVVPPLAPLGSSSPAIEQARREAATAARIQTQGAAGEINEWLDRPGPN